MKRSNLCAGENFHHFKVTSQTVDDSIFIPKMKLFKNNYVIIMSLFSDGTSRKCTKLVLKLGNIPIVF